MDSDRMYRRLGTTREATLANALHHVAEAARGTADARLVWEMAIRVAVNAGASQRQVAELAGVSHTEVQRIIKRSPGRVIDTAS